MVAMPAAAIDARPNASALRLFISGDLTAKFILMPDAFSSGVQRTSSSWMNFADCSGPELVSGSNPALINLS